MNRRTRFFAGVLAACALVALTAFAGAAELELKKLGDGAPGPDGQPPADYLFRYCQPQTVVGQIGAAANPSASRLMSMMAPQTGGEKPAFDEVVTIDRDYELETPFQGVLQLGDNFYGFTCDAVDADEDATIPALNRLYVDLDGDGDLTDEEGVDAIASQTPNASYAICSYDVLDITIEADGVEYDYAVRPYVYAQNQPGFVMAYARFSACAYREGEIELDGETHSVVLVDYNSNGLFNDKMELSASRRITQGDRLYIDPSASDSANVVSRGPVPGNGMYQVGPLVDLEGTLCDLTIAASGATLDLVTSERGIGYITNATDNFQAVVYGELGVLNVTSEDGRAALPEGEWNILSYTLDATGWEETEGTPQRTSASASSPTDAKPVTIVADEDAEMTFGAPFRTVVDARPSGDTVSLGLSILGAAGERCTSLTVNGTRPPAPKFTITNEQGEVVDTGDFEYG
jgi:hypothetical protein